MYTRQQASQLRQAFWTIFGQYMSPVPSAEGEKINWINYKTGEKHIAFKMEAANNFASIAIEITHPDLGMQQLYFEQFEQLKKPLHTALQEEWIWSLHLVHETGRTVSRIYKQSGEQSILNKADWPGLISFFKPRIIALDQFWCEAKYAFEILR